MLATDFDCSTIERLFAEERAGLKNTLYKYLRNEADVEDVLQESFVKMLNALLDGTEVRHAKGFLYTIARNLALDLLRSQARKTRLFHSDHEPLLESDYTGSLIDQAADPITVEWQAELRQNIYFVVQVIEELPPKCKMSFYLIKFEEKSYSEVSQELGMSISSIEKYVQKASALLVDRQSANHGLAQVA